MAEEPRSCLFCCEPGTAGADTFGGVYCPIHWAEREARLNDAFAARSALEPVVPVEVVAAKTEELRQRMAERCVRVGALPYRD